MMLLILAALVAAKDTTYGRIEGDMTLAFGAGTTITARGPSGAIDVRARYLETAGVFVTYEEGFGGPAEPTRVFVTGVEMRPFFLARWLQGAETGFAFGDLFMDSFGIEVGAAFLQPKMGNFGDRIALQAGLALEFPLFLKANGLWLGVHGGGRFSDRGLGYEAQTPLEQSVYFTFTLSWHQVIGTHVVDLGDRVR